MNKIFFILLLLTSLSAQAFEIGGLGPFKRPAPETPRKPTSGPVINGRH